MSTAQRGDRSSGSKVRRCPLSVAFTDTMMSLSLTDFHIICVFPLKKIYSHGRCSSIHSRGLVMDPTLS
jgi:hypothetical protein